MIFVNIDGRPLRGKGKRSGSGGRARCRAAYFWGLDPKRMAHIILCTDFSEGAMHAALHAVRLFGSQDQVYTLMHAYMDAVPINTSWPGLADELYRSTMQGMAEWADKLRGMPECAGAVIRTEVLQGTISGALNDLAREKHADLAVVGTRGHAGADLWGSGAAEVVKHGALPVLVVPDQAMAGPVAKILYADDGGRVEVSGTRVLLHIAAMARAEVLLAHVLKNRDEVPDPAVVAMYEELLQAVPHRFMVVEGEDVAAAIDLLAEREGADMVAVLHRHAGFMERLFHASTAKRLAMHSSLPLLVMPELDLKEARMPH